VGENHDCSRHSRRTLRIARFADHALTPGALNSAVTQENIASTICRSGYTKTIRPPVRYTNALKAKQLRGMGSPHDYEEDHLVPLELGGHPSDPKNLWPEHWNGAFGAHTKDVLENKLHRLVCDHRITLKTAQEAIAQNWIVAYWLYVQRRNP
jgi:hypothetical protein